MNPRLVRCRRSGEQKLPVRCQRPKLTPKDTGPIIQTGLSPMEMISFSTAEVPANTLGTEKGSRSSAYPYLSAKRFTLSSSAPDRSCPICNGQAYDPRKICCINGKLVPHSPIEDLEECPDRKQLVGRPNEYDGCSVPWFIRIGEDKDNPAGGTDTAFSDTSIHGIRPQAFVPKLPCHVHDKCYQTCNPDPVAKELCDMKLIVDASRVCNNSTEDEQVREPCKGRGKG